MLHKVHRLWTVLASYIIIFDCMLRHTNLIWLGSHYLHSSANFAPFKSNYAEQNIVAIVTLVISYLWVYSIYFYCFWLVIFRVLFVVLFFKKFNAGKKSKENSWAHTQTLYNHIEIIIISAMAKQLHIWNNLIL